MGEEAKLVQPKRGVRLFIKVKMDDVIDIADDCYFVQLTLGIS